MPKYNQRKTVRSLPVNIVLSPQIRQKLPVERQRLRHFLI